MTDQTTHTRSRGKIRFLLWLLSLLIGAIIIGFFAFSYNVTRDRTPAAITKADGIVVWTGKGGGRLDTGAALFRQGLGERLLISGVNAQNSRDKIITLLNLPAERADCCVDLDYAALDTVGNARETANWSAALGYEHIVLVTSAYHMPRARIELNSRRRALHVTPYPVAGETGPDWWKNPTQIRRLLREYGKLLLTYLRRPSAQDDRMAPPLPPLTNMIDPSPAPQND